MKSLVNLSRLSNSAVHDRFLVVPLADRPQRAPLGGRQSVDAAVNLIRLEIGIVLGGVVEPQHTLDLVVGQEAAKARLREDAELISKGALEAAPMGYLLCGAVGTGKTN